MAKVRAELQRLSVPVPGCAQGGDALVAVATHPDADVVLFASSGTAGLDAVLAAIATLDFGDVLILEAQVWLNSTLLLGPIEAYDAEYDAIRLATALGIIVVEAGGIEAIFTSLAIHHQVSPPTINIFNRDPECDLDYCANEARPMRIDLAVSNSFGFGGTNGTLVIRRFS